MRLLLRNTSLTFSSDCILQANIKRRVKGTTEYQTMRVTIDGVTWEDPGADDACEPQDWPSLFRLVSRYERRVATEE